MTVAGLAVVLCLGAATMTHAAPIDRSQRPPIGPQAAPATPAITRFTLGNGLPVWMVRRAQVPLVTAVLQIRCGSAHDGARAGLAAMTAALLDDGTATKSATAFAEAVDFLGASLTAGAGEEQTGVTLQCLSRHLDAGLDLMGEMVAHPAFLGEELDRERLTRRQMLKQQRDLPAVIASQTFNRVVFGAAHPYGRPPQGTAAAVEAVTREDIAALYARYYRPNNAVLIVVGDVEEKPLRARLERAFAGWTQQPVPEDAAAAPARPASQPMRVVMVDKPGAAQSEIRIGHAGAARSTAADYYALQVMNILLGGQFTSRVNLNLRERHGFTYGARTQWSFRRGDGPFFAAAGVFTAKTDSAVTEFLGELKDIRGPRPATAAEVEAARNSLVRAFPRRLETNEGVAGQLADLAFFGLPETEIGEFNQRIAKVTPEEVTRVAGRYIDPGALAVVIVGDLAKIRPGIEALGLGPLQELDPDGRAVSR